MVKIPWGLIKLTLSAPSLRLPHHFNDPIVNPKQINKGVYGIKGTLLLISLANIEATIHTNVYKTT